MSKSVFGIAASIDQSSAIVRRLKNAGFADQDISVLLPDKSGTRDFAHKQSTKAPEGATAGASAGGAIGGTLGLLAGIGALTIPGAGPFIAAGPILAFLSGAAAGAAAGGLAGALIGMGIPEYEAKRYEGKIMGGNILISVHTESGDEAKTARTILEEEGAQDINSAGEVAAEVKVVKDTPRTVV
jgi:hypothetical protein